MWSRRYDYRSCNDLWRVGTRSRCRQCSGNLWSPAEVGQSHALIKSLPKGRNIEIFTSPNLVGGWSIACVSRTNSRTRPYRKRSLDRTFFAAKRVVPYLRFCRGVSSFTLGTKVWVIRVFHCALLAGERTHERDFKVVYVVGSALAAILTRNYGSQYNSPLISKR